MRQLEHALGLLADRAEHLPTDVLVERLEERLSAEGVSTATAGAADGAATGYPQRHPESIITPACNLDEVAARAKAEFAAPVTTGLGGRFVRRPWVAGFGTALATLLIVGGVALMFRLIESPITDEPSQPGIVQTTPAPTAQVVVPTSEVAATTAVAAPFSGVVPLDADATGPQWGQPSLAFDSEGRPQVLYRKTDTIVGLASCDDRSCSSVSTYEVYTTERGERTGSLVGTPRPGTGPVFWIGAGGDAFEELKTRLVACSDATCREPTFIELTSAGSGPPAIATDSSGQTLVVSTDRAQPTALSVLRCVEPACIVDATSRIVWQSPPEEWLAATSAVALDSGLPVIASRTDQGILIGECAEPDCLPPPEGSGITPVTSIPIEDAVRGPGLVLGAGGAPITVVEVNASGSDAETYLGAIVVAACVDAACSDVEVTELAHTSDPYMEWSMAAGPDGRLRIAWTAQDALFLATCHDSTCSQFSVVDTGHPADDVALAFDSTGAPTLATTSQERGLELVLCGDDTCQTRN